MINQEEFAICKRRGHQVKGTLENGYQQCSHCGAWVREVRTIEEREDDPPVSERHWRDREKP